MDAFAPLRLCLMFILPFGTIANDANWTAVGGELGADPVKVIDDPLGWGRKDEDFIRAAAAQTGGFFIQFVYPRYFRHTVYTGGEDDGTPIADKTTIEDVTFHYRASLQSAGSADLTLVFVERVTLTSHNLQVTTLNSTAFADFSFTMILNPFTDQPLDPSDLPSSGGPDETTANDYFFGFSTTAPAVAIRVSHAYLTWTEKVGTPDGRARKGPTRREPAYFCAICAKPKHRSELTRIEDERHPFNGHLVCEDDIDELDPEPTFPRIPEGEFDPDNF